MNHQDSNNDSNNSRSSNDNQSGIHHEMITPAAAQRPPFVPIASLMQQAPPTHLISRSSPPTIAASASTATSHVTSHYPAFRPYPQQVNATSQYTGSGTNGRTTATENNSNNINNNHDTIMGNNMDFNMSTGNIKIRIGSFNNIQRISSTRPQEGGGSVGVVKSFTTSNDTMDDHINNTMAATNFNSSDGYYRDNSNHQHQHQQHHTSTFATNTKGIATTTNYHHHIFGQPSSTIQQHYHLHQRHDLPQASPLFNSQQQHNFAFNNCHSTNRSLSTSTSNTNINNTETIDENETCTSNFKIIFSDNPQSNKMSSRLLLSQPNLDNNSNNIRNNGIGGSIVFNPICTSMRKDASTTSIKYTMGDNNKISNYGSIRIIPNSNNNNSMHLLQKREIPSSSTITTATTNNNKNNAATTTTKMKSKINQQSKKRGHLPSTSVTNKQNIAPIKLKSQQQQMKKKYPLFINKPRHRKQGPLLNYRFGCCNENELIMSPISSMNGGVKTIPTSIEISNSIPSSASSIFHIFDRRIDLDSVPNDANLYELLRGWIQDDPYRIRPVAGSNLLDHVIRPSKKRKIVDHEQCQADDEISDDTKKKDKKDDNIIKDNDDLDDQEGMDKGDVNPDINILSVVKMTKQNQCTSSPDDILREYILKAKQKKHNVRMKRKQKFEPIKKRLNSMGIRV